MQVREKQKAIPEIPSRPQTRSRQMIWRPHNASRVPKLNIRSEGCRMHIPVTREKPNTAREVYKWRRQDLTLPKPPATARNKSGEEPRRRKSRENTSQSLTSEKERSKPLSDIAWGSNYNHSSSVDDPFSGWC